MRARWSGAWCLVLIPLWLSGSTPSASPSGEEIWRLDCGVSGVSQSGFIDGDGNLWMVDEPFAGLYRWGQENASEAFVDRPVAGTGLDTVYATHAWGDTRMIYRVRLPNGLYQVQLLFSEMTHRGPGERIFDVALEGNLVLDDHDVYVHVGSDTADAHSFGVVVTDQQLDITFPEIKADHAMLAGLAVKVVHVSDDDFLDFLEKRMFYYFLNHSHPSTGLVPPSLYNWGPASYDSGGLGVSGLSLSVLAAAVSRGWISLTEATAQAQRLLDTLNDPLVQVRGFPFDRLGWATGLASPEASLSSFESALFALSGEAAAGYHKETTPALAQRIQATTDAMEWAWWLGDGQSALYKGWRATGNDSFSIPSFDPPGYFGSEAWDTYSESLAVNLAALGSAFFPVPSSVHERMGRPWKRLYGTDVLHAPALSQHMWPHLFFDLSSRFDSHGTDFFENARRALEINRRACQEDPLGRFDRYRWGLSGAFGPDGAYRLYGVEPNPQGIPDGTVDPNAVLMGLTFDPTESLKAARHLFFQYKHRIFGIHGFCDGFNASLDTRAEVADGLDLGAAILAIENYRSGFPRSLFMGTAAARSALEALSMSTQIPNPTYQSSTAQSPPSLAFDGNPGTVWESAPDDPQWLSAYLGGGRSVGKVSLVWDAALSRRYKIQISLDGSQWDTVAEQMSGEGDKMETWEFQPVTARFVRLYGYQRGDSGGYRLAEMSIKASEGTSLRVYPNPFHPSGGHRTARITGLTPNGTLTISSFSGDTVRRLTADEYGTAQWDGRNTSGGWVPTDTYTIQPEGRDDRLRLIFQR